MKLQKILISAMMFSFLGCLNVYADTGMIDNSKPKVRTCILKTNKKITSLKRDPVYNPYDLSIKSNITVEQAYQMLSGTTYQTFECAKAFVDAEKQDTPVNSLFLISLTRLESGHGTNDIAVNQNNISSWRISRSGYRTFESKSECINKTAKLLSDEYLSTDGNFYKGKSIWNINRSYCEQDSWSEKINELINEIKKGDYNG